MRRRHILIFSLLACVLATTPVAVGQEIDEPSVRFPVLVNRKHGYIDEQGQVVIQPRFELVMNFSEGLAAVMENSHWNYIDKSGKVVIATQSTMVKPFSEGLAAVLLNGRYGYIDKKGKVVIKPKFELAFDFSEGLARVKLIGQWAFIDKLGNTVFVAPFDYADDFKGGFAVVAKQLEESSDRGFARGELKVSYIGKSGGLSPMGWCNAASRFSGGLAAISKDPNIIAGITRGELIIDNLDVTYPAFPFLKPVTYSFINTSGQTVFEGTYQQVQEFADGRAAVRVKEKWGYINELGEMIIPAQFDSAQTFSEGLAFVRLNDEGYFIDRTGKIIFKTNASVITPFTNGLVKVLSCTVPPCRYAYVDKRGTIVWQRPETESAKLK